jgi:hypothetical protein
MAESALQVVDRQTPLARQSFEPTTIQEAMEFAKMIADSELLPKDFRGKTANILVALQIGKELNIPPLQALQGIYVVNGRGVVFGDLMWAIITSHKDFEDSKEDVTDTGATVTLKRRGRSPVTVTFTKVDAEKASLWGKAGPWTQYPKRQMLWRARTFAARDLFPDALKGLTSAEEASDYQTIEGQTVPTTPAQATASATPVEETIGTEGGSLWYKAYKAHGWTKEDAQKYLSETFQIGSPHNDKDSRSIPKAKLDEAMKWANTNAPIREQAVRLFTDLNWTKEECENFISQQKWNWAVIVDELSKEISKRNSAEQ